MPESDTPTPPTATERQEWARLCEAATPGPLTTEDFCDYVFVVERGNIPIFESRGTGASLPQTENRRYLVALWNNAPRLLHALDAAEQRAERAERERDGMYEALGMLTALHESDYDNEPPPARPAWLQDALGGEARKVADARDAAHYDAVTREMTRREAAESALAALRAESEGMRASRSAVPDAAKAVRETFERAMGRGLRVFSRDPEQEYRFDLTGAEWHTLETLLVLIETWAAPRAEGPSCG